MTRRQVSRIPSQTSSDATPVQLAIDGLDSLVLLPSRRVPDRLRLSPETRRRGLEQIARLRAELDSRRSGRTSHDATAA